MVDFGYELLGAIYGDGHVHTTENRITIVGSLEDFYYYYYYLKPQIENFFNVNVYVRQRKDRNAFYLSFESKEVFEYLLNKGLLRGAKVNLGLSFFENEIQVVSFLRGLFDTDGSLKFSKQTQSINYYPRIQLVFRDNPFSKELGSLFEKLGFNYAFWYSGRDKQNCYQISGKINLEKWNKIIGFSNPVHKTKYLYWKENSCYEPYSSLDSRLKTLNLKIEALFLS